MNSADRDPPALAADALRRVARDERVKAYIENDPVLFPILLRAARRYIGGTTRAECLDTVAALNAAGHAATVDYMGESTRDPDLAERETAEFVRLAADIGRRGLDSSLSLDLSHIGLAVDPRLALANARRIAAAAREIGTEMIISMEGAERIEAILEVYRALCAEFDNVGVTLQARLRRTEEDLPAMLALPGKVRLVKGAYEEAPDIAYPRESAELAACYRDYARRMLTSGRPVSIGTHDASIHDDVDRFVTERDLRGGPFEFEALVGLGDAQIDRLRRQGYQTRVYVVYGREWYLYVCHRLAEEPTRLYRALADLVGIDRPATSDTPMDRSTLFPHR
jgi:proline dehydrogenase